MRWYGGDRSGGLVRNGDLARAAAMTVNELVVAVQAVWAPSVAVIV